MAIVLLTLVAETRAQNSKSEFKFGERPPDGVFDQKGILLPTQRQEIAEPLANVLKNERIDVIVVILPDIGDAPPKHVAKVFRDEWSVSPVNAVVLEVTGNPDSPWIFPGDLINRVVDASKLQEWVEAGERRANAEPDEFGKIRAAAVEATDIMRYCSGGALLRTEAIISERLRQQLAYEKRQRLLKLAAGLGLAGAIPIVIGLVFLFTNIGKNRPRNFPAVRKTTRLGAPYAGGNNAICIPKTY